MHVALRLWLLGLALLAVACGSNPALPFGDGGLAADAGVGVPDGESLPDGGPLDGGSTDDGGPFDDGGAPTDGGFVDGGSIDGGSVDGGSPDGGTGTDGGVPPRPPGPYPQNGWTHATAPNGRLLGFDLSKTNEDDLLRPGGEAALYALGATVDDFHPERHPVVLVHGIQGDPDGLQTVVDRIWSLPVQLYVLAYDDYQRRTSFNGDDLADELRALAALLGSGRDLSIVAHSMGGIVSRWALNRLTAGSAGEIEAFGAVALLGVDTPWHGYEGPEDGWMMDIARLFMPDGLEDMRALSGEFQGIPGHADPVRREGLYGVILPASVRISLVFAQSGDTVIDYTEDVVAGLPEQLVAHYRDGTDVTGDPRLVNTWKAMRGSDLVAALDAQLQAQVTAGTIDATSVLAVLERLFPRFPGDHVTVLDEHPGEPSLLDFITERVLGP